MGDIDPHRTLSLESPSELYHEASKIRESDGATARTVWMVNTSPQIKQVIAKPSAAHRGFPTLALPREPLRLERALDEVMLGRSSIREFGGGPLSQLELSALLHYGAGVSRSLVDSDGIEWGFRFAPSGGALYPIDIYCVVLNVVGAEAGVHAYNPADHALELLAPGDHTERLAAATYLTGMHTAAVYVVLVANFLRSKFKYGERAYRFVLLEAGHIAQNMLLAGECLGLGGVPIGGYMDDPLNELIGVDGCDRAVVYSVLFGTKPGVSPAR